MQVEPLGERQRVEAGGLRLVVPPVAGEHPRLDGEHLGAQPAGVLGQQVDGLLGEVERVLVGLSVSRAASARAASIRARQAAGASAGSWASCSASSAAARVGWPELVSASAALTASLERSTSTAARRAGSASSSSACS